MLELLSWLIPAIGLSLAILYFVVRYAKAAERGHE